MGRLSTKAVGGYALDVGEDAPAHAKTRSSLASIAGVVYGIGALRGYEVIRASAIDGMEMSSAN